MAATSFLIDVSNKRGVAGLSDPNPIVPPDISVPGNYDFNLYYLNYASPYTYHRFPSASQEINLRVDGPPSAGKISLGFLGYSTPLLDMDVTNDDLINAFMALRSVGTGNAEVSGNKVDGWTFEFIGERAGLPQSAISCDVSNTLEPSEAIVDPVQAGGSGVNSKQRLRIKQLPVATTNNFTELTAGSLWGWTTATPLSTSGISPTFWELPLYDIILEVKLYTAGSRSGTDGVTTDPADRTGTDGVTTSDGRGRTGTDMVCTKDADRTGSDGQLYANDLTKFKSTSANFTSADVGKAITGTHIASGTTIASIIDDTFCRLSQDHTGTGAFSAVSWVVVGNIKITVTSATGAFTNADLGHTFTGTNIPENTVITAINSSTKITLSKTPTATGLGLTWAVVGVIFNSYSTATGAFTQADIGRTLSSANVLAGTTIATVVDATHITLSTVPTAAGTGLSWTLVVPIENTFTSATATFVSGDIGKTLVATNVPGGTTIVSIVSGTKVNISNRPTAAGTGLTWRIYNPAATAPVVTEITPGAFGPDVFEVQQVAFSQIPAYGSFTIQGGGGGPVATIPCPLDPSAIASAMGDAYPSFAPWSVEMKADSVFWITFGKAGNNANLVVSDANVIYDYQVLRLVLNGAAARGLETEVAGFPTVIVGNIAYFGGVTVATPCGEQLYDSLSDGTKAFRYRQRFCQLKQNFARQALNAAGPNGTFLVSEENMEDKNGMVMWDRVWCSMPQSRVETHQQMRACIGTAKTFQGATLIDQQLYSVSISTWVKVHFTYSRGIGGLGVPPDGPAGTIIHYINGVSVLLAFNGFDINTGTFYNQFTQSWTRRRWMGDIWEQAVYVN